MQKSAQKTGGQPRIDPSDRNSIALFSYGFRPFFLGSALWAIVALALWIGSLQGQFQLAPHYGALPWHGHEMLFGYGSGVVAGFLLTAVPNWTGRLPVAGVRLMALFSLWCVGRIALLATSVTGPLAAAVIDSLFLPCLLVVMGREILVGENWRNLMPLALMGIFAIANIDFHAEVLTTGASNYGLRAGVAALVGLIAVIGGRITPSYTHNWLSRAGSPVLPAPFGLFDKLALLTTCVALAAWIALPATTMTALLFLVAAGVLSVRLWRWRGTHTWQEPLLLVLHLGYAFVPLGFLLVAVPILAPNLLTGTAALHAWTVGAVGLMTLGVMSRATRGHTGHALNASPMTVASYGTMIVAALLRIAAGFFFQAYMMLVELAGAAWIIASLLSRIRSDAAPTTAGARINAQPISPCHFRSEFAPPQRRSITGYLFELRLFGFALLRFLFGFHLQFRKHSLVGFVVIALICGDLLEQVCCREVAVFASLCRKVLLHFGVLVLLASHGVE